MLGGAEGDRLAELERGLDVGEHDRGGAVRHQRAIGALERAGDERIFLALGAAEIVAEILAHLRVRIADAVLVVLGGDHGQRIGLVAPFLEIEAGDLAEDAGEAAVDLGFLAHVGCFQQVAPDLGAGVVVICSTPTQSTMRAARASIALMPLMHGGRTGGAGVLDPGRALEAQIGRGLQHQRGGKILCRKAGVEMPEHDLVDVLGRDAGIGQRLAGHPHDQAFDALTAELSEGGMGPADDTGGHRSLPLPNFGRIGRRCTAKSP